MPLVWNRPGENPKLGENEIHLWAARLNHHVHRVDECYSLLSKREKDRIDRLKIPKARQRYILSRGILRKLLQYYSGTAAACLDFRFGPKGKPSLAPIGDRVLSFNNTDCSDLAVYAFSWNRELGVDLEIRPRSVRAERIARRRFATSEAREILSQADAAIDDTFLSCWTRKEAWGKAIGRGIHYPMRETILCDRMHTAEFLYVDDDIEWRLMQFNIDEASTACLVARESDWYPRAFIYETERP